MIEWRNDSELVRRVMSGWVHQLARWDWILHLTFRDRVFVAHSQKITRGRSVWECQRRVESFFRSELYGRPYFYALEQNPSRDGFHCHALMANCRGDRRDAAWAKWFEVNGRNRIEPVRCMSDVEDYVSKYVTKVGQREVRRALAGIATQPTRVTTPPFPARGRVFFLGNNSMGL